MSNAIRAHVGLLRETYLGENRVALVPEDVKLLTKKCSVLFERGCGLGAGYSDDEYIAAGARATDVDDLTSSLLVLVGVRQPSEGVSFSAASTLICLGRTIASEARHVAANPRLVDLARLPGKYAALGTDIVSRQAAIVGHAATLEAVRLLGASYPLIEVQGTSVRRMRMAAIGDGPANRQALATGRRLGASTYNIAPSICGDITVDVCRSFVPTAPNSPAHQAYSPDAVLDLRYQLARKLSGFQLITTNVQTGGQRVPILFDEFVLRQLSEGTIIVDLAADSGGNCALTRIDQTVSAFGVHVVGLTTLASREAGEASRQFSRGVRRLLEAVIETEIRCPTCSWATPLTPTTEG